MACALRDCLFEMKGSGGVVRFHVGEKGCVSISEEEFRSLKESAPLATVVGLGDGVATVERFSHGRLESSAERGGVVLPARSEVRMDCVGMFLGIDLADPAAAFENCWRHSQAARTEGRPEELPPALLRLAQEIDAREPFRVEHAFEGAPCAEADVSKLAFKRAMAKIPKHAAGWDAAEG